MKDRRKNSYKPAIRSRTIAAALGIIIVNLAALAGWTVDAENASLMIEAVITIAGAIYVICRRFKTWQQINGMFTSNHEPPERP
jgi:hypothetical protein